MQSLTRRAAESHFVYLTVVLPCRAGLKMICWCKWLQRVVTLNSASFNRDWYQVASEMPGRLPQQCRECNRNADIFAQLTFLLLRISVSRVQCAPAPSPSSRRIACTPAPYCTPTNVNAPGSHMHTVSLASPYPPHPHVFRPDAPRSHIHIGSSVFATQTPPRLLPPSARSIYANSIKYVCQ